MKDTLVTLVKTNILTALGASHPVQARQALQFLQLQVGVLRTQWLVLIVKLMRLEPLWEQISSHVCLGASRIIEVGRSALSVGSTIS